MAIMDTILTCGVFDIIHAGHINFFKWITNTFPLSYIIVGLNTDTSLKRLKRETLHNYDERFLVLSSIKWIDKVIPMNYINPTKLIEKIKPNYFVKGGDYKGKEKTLPEYYAMNLYTKNGKLIICPLEKTHSSRKIAKEIS